MTRATAGRWLLSTALTASAATAQSPIVVPVSGTSACPAPDQVAAAIVQLTPEERRQDVPPGARVEVNDAGERYRVTVRTNTGKTQRTFDDVARDCQKRVRFTAVFAVTTLMPPEFALESAAEPEDSSAAPEPEPEPEPAAAPKPPPTPVPSPPPIAPSRRPPLVFVEANLLAETGSPQFDVVDAFALGAELRAALAPRSYGATFGVSYMPPSDLRLDGVDLQVSRIAGSAGVRVRIVDSPIDLSSDVELLVMLERVQGVGLAAPAQDRGINAGGRLGLTVAPPWPSRLLPVAGVHAIVFPAPRSVTMLPRGEVGHTPSVWLGVSAGMALGL